MYVDDALIGTLEDDSAVKLKGRGFQLTKWASNSQKVMKPLLFMTECQHVYQLIKSTGYFMEHKKG